jgi:hypothetical protein
MVLIFGRDGTDKTLIISFNINWMEKLQIYKKIQ